jgi:hypothetical protein
LAIKISLSTCKHSWRNVMMMNKRTFCKVISIYARQKSFSKCYFNCKPLTTCQFVLGGCQLYNHFQLLLEMGMQ